MIEGVPIVAEVVSFDPSGFVDHNAAGLSRFPATVLRIDEPAEMRGTMLTFVVDRDVAGADILTRPGQRVRLLLDAESQGLDPIFAGALIDGAVHRLPTEGA
jgi:hypothetical protein